MYLACARVSSIAQGFVGGRPRIISSITPLMPHHHHTTRHTTSLGNAAFKAGDYTKAIEHYSEAIKLDPTAHTYWSNRSASYAGLNDWENAANDAAECIKADKNFVKGTSLSPYTSYTSPLTPPTHPSPPPPKTTGYFRLALAQKNLQRYEAALETITRGLGVDFGNNDLKGMRKEVEDGVRMQKVATIIETATKQFGAKDYSGALGTIEQGLRIDAGNSSLVALKAKVQPLWDKEEKTRKAGLSPVEKMKEEGDTMYKNASFEKAIQQYSKTLDKIDDKGSEIALKVYSNRAACYKQLSNFDGVISDCTSVLEVRPDDVKSLLRRAQAFEAVERYKMALQDVRTLLALPADQVGPSNTTIANGLQHRLNRVIQKLRDV